MKNSLQIASKESILICWNYVRGHGWYLNCLEQYHLACLMTLETWSFFTALLLRLCFHFSKTVTQQSYIQLPQAGVDVVKAIIIWTLMKYQVTFPMKMWYLHTRKINNICCAHSWNIFQQQKRKNFLSPRGHVISSIYYINTNERSRRLLCKNMSSSHLKISLLLWLHNKLCLCPSHLWKIYQKY